jgi:Transposase DDE domain/Insertion element 4 transposase N-terminal
MPYSRHAFLTRLPLAWSVSCIPHTRQGGLYVAHQITCRPSGQVESYRRQLQHSSQLPITNLLSIEDVEEALTAEGCSFRERIFTPLLTIWVFLSQVLDPDHSCRQAVLRLVGWLAAQGRKGCSSNTGAYCKARARLPEGVLARLTRSSGRKLEKHSPRDWHWHGKRVRLADGTTASMPDTEANQREYPQSRAQKPGVGFPLMRIVVIFSLAVGTVLEAAFNPYRGKETGETTMLRALLGCLELGDLLLGDRNFANYWLIALALQSGLDVVLRQHQRRKVDFRTGKRLGKDDHLITWTKPIRPPWMSQATYDALPGTLTLRELRLRIPKGKNRTREIVVVTTLRDAGRYTKGELQALYRLRWQAEINLRSLKTTMQMNVLRCQAPDRVRKEIWAHFLVYNLIRTAMAQAAQAHQSKPWQISFKGTQQALHAFGGFWPTARPRDPDAYYDDFLQAVAEHAVGHRPDRWEPRAKKRRPNKYRLLNEPRAQAKARLANVSGRWV